jgi:hypothetical protein
MARPADYPPGLLRSSGELGRQAGLPLATWSMDQQNAEFPSQITPASQFFVEELVTAAVKGHDLIACSQ